MANHLGGMGGDGEEDFRGRVAQVAVALGERVQLVAPEVGDEPEVHHGAVDDGHGGYRRGPAAPLEMPGGEHHQRQDEDRCVFFRCQEHHHRGDEQPVALADEAMDRGEAEERRERFEVEIERDGPCDTEAEPVGDAGQQGGGLPCALPRAEVEGDDGRAQEHRLGDEQRARSTARPHQRHEHQQRGLPVVARVGDGPERVLEGFAVGGVPRDLGEDTKVPGIGMESVVEEEATRRPPCREGSRNCHGEREQSRHGRPIRPGCVHAPDCNARAALIRAGRVHSPRGPAAYPSPVPTWRGGRRNGLISRG